jgi:hypothetical protein
MEAFRQSNGGYSAAVPVLDSGADPMRGDSPSYETGVRAVIQTPFADNLEQSHRRGKRVAIVQSNYIPWKGYFDLIRQVDEFILYDDAQYTRRDWRNRNKIKTPSGIHWLTIPVQVKGKYFQKIKDTLVADADWGRVHWRTLCQSYAKAPCFQQYAEMFEALYLGSSKQSLSEINRDWISLICGILGIGAKISWSMDYEIHTDDRTGKLIELCQRAGAQAYLSGPAAQSYMDEAAFRQAGIQVDFIDYSGYPEYPQLYPPFDHFVSIVDLLFMEGDRATNFMKPI